ncbi:PcfJ domain-containing protein [Umboniibacter marinipuniceus]|uniref:PcfJ-like protein n=1 Tax=Umboniibacter marinipuniceus TaxID=569599 RepID=A0A3M0AGJ4_9GAMM|nr:PcfJ domain-containing protein [Umboniibacter marinipuniceus]RMA82679.1 PcfJ-like protein [Umboniibacter marinipuniceus]
MSIAVVEPDICCQPDGNLRIDWTNVLGFRCVNIIKPWCGFLEGFVENDEEEIDPVYVFDLPISLHESRDNPDLADWFNTIPEDILNRCKALPSIQLFVLYCACKSRDASDLLVSNPVLLYLWAAAQHNDLKSYPEDISARLSLLKAKQYQVLQQIAPDAPKASVKLLKRLTPNSISRLDRNKLLVILQNQNLVSKLSHQRDLKGMHFEIADAYPWALTHAISDILANLTRDERRIVNDTIAMSNGGAIPVLVRCTTWPEVVACHDRWARQWTNRRRFQAKLLRDDNGMAIPFPPPPVKPSGLINWLSTPEEVIDEGRAMRHCVASYAQRVQRGEYALYHMSEPANLTIGLRRSVAGWQLDQVRGICNRLPTKEELEAIDEWFLGNKNC